MQEWQEIIKTALVGTERSPLPSFGGEDDFGRLLGRLNPSERERSLLRSAAVLACCRRAGSRIPTEDASLPHPAVQEDRPSIGPVQLHNLDLMLAGQFDEALPDWLAAVVAKGRRIPEERLPELLDLGHRKSDLRSAITGVIGRRGRWLADMRSEWKYAAQHSLFDRAVPAEISEMDAEEALRRWAVGARDERLALLEGLRIVEPARARELVARTWLQDTVEDRALFLETFSRGLSLADEPLLERALDDRRKEVRQAAAELLARLPASGFCRRMIDRVDPIVQMVPGYGRADTLKITMPDGADPAMLRDGVPPKPQPGSGEQTWLSMHLLAAVPLSHWCEKFGKTPAQIVAANRSNQWIETLLIGWTRALNRFPDLEWAQALLDSWTDSKHVSPPHKIAPWADLLPPARLEECAMRLIRDNNHPMSLDHPAAGLLQECRHIWGVELTGMVVSRIQEALKGPQNQGYYVVSALERFAPLMSAEAGPELQLLIEEAATRNQYLKGRLERYNALAQFRVEMMRWIEEGA